MKKYSFFRNLFFSFAIISFSCIATNEKDPKIASLDSKINAAVSDTLRIKLRTEKLLLIWSNDSTAGETEFKNIVAEISKLKIKGHQLQLYYGLSKTLYQSKYSKAFQQSQQLGLSVAQKIKKGNWKSKFYKNYAEFFKHQNDLNKSIACYDTAIMVIDSPDPAYKAELYTMLGRNYYHNGDYRNAMLKYIEAQRIYETYRIKNEDYAQIFHFIGSVFKRQNNDEKALSYYQKMLEIAKEIGSNTVECEALDLLAGRYWQLGNSKKSFELRHQALALAKQTNDYDLQVMITLNLASYYFSEKQFDKALLLINDAEKIGKTNNALDVKNEVFLYLLKGSTLSKTRNFKLAIEYLNKALSQAKGTYKKKLLNLSDLHAELAYAYSGMGDYKSAYENILIHMDYNDSLINAENIRANNDLEKKYEAEKKEAEIKLLNLDKTIQRIELEKERSAKNLFIAGFCIAFFLAGVISFMYIKYRKSNAFGVKEKNTSV